MQTENMLSCSQIAECLIGNLSLWSFVVNVLLLVSTVVYVVLTYKLWRAALDNQKDLIENQIKMSNIDKYFTFRRTWKSNEFIKARNRAFKLWQFLPKPVKRGVGMSVPNTEGMGSWEDFSLLAHFIADVYIECKRGNITHEEIREGFPEFRWWAPRLQQLFANIEGEERMVEILGQVQRIVPQTIGDRAKLRTQFK